MKKVLSIILCATILLTVTSFTSFLVKAEELKYRDLTYTLSAGEVTITGCDKSATGALEIPATIEDCPVTKIGSGAFSRCSSLTSIKIPNSVTSVGGIAFQLCTGLTSITIPNSVTSIGGAAFMDCSNLKSIDISNRVTSIGSFTFSGCSSLTSIFIPNSVTSIGGAAFEKCSNLKSINIADSVININSFDFADTAYYNDETNWNDGVLYIGNHLIEAKQTLSGSYEIKTGTKTIANYAFGNCSALASITLPKSLETISTYAFSNCARLKDVYYVGTETDRKAIAIYDGNSLLTEATWHYTEKSTTTTQSTTAKVTAAQDNTTKPAGTTVITPSQGNTVQDDLSTTPAPSESVTASDAAATLTTAPQNDSSDTADTEHGGSSAPVWIAVGVILLAAAGMAAFAIIRKRQ